MKITSPVVLFASVAILLGCSKPYPDNSYPPSGGEKKWTVSTIAGDGRPVFAEGNAFNASLRLPNDVVINNEGTLYIADMLNHRIRMLKAGNLSTLAGNGTEDTQNGEGTKAGFSLPGRLAIDKEGNLYILDLLDARIRKVTPAGMVTTHAGEVEKGFRNGPAGNARFAPASGIVADRGGNLFLSDAGNHRLRKVSSEGEVTTFAGTGNNGFANGNIQSAEFSYPHGLLIDKQQNLYVADQTQIRKITHSGWVSTFAGKEKPGFADGPAQDAMFSFISGMVMDLQGNIYLTDEHRIRKVTTSGEVTTIAGSMAGYDNGEGSSARFDTPQGIAIDGKGNLYVADSHNHRIRKISHQ